jgi:hypothetical protein
VADRFEDILNALGFVNIGSLRYRIDLRVWWHQEHSIQIIVLPLGSRYLLKGFKDYYLKSISQEGESWAREIGPLQDFLESCLPEIRITFSHFRDITSKHALLQIQRRFGQGNENLNINVEGIATLQHQLNSKISQLNSNEQIIKLTGDSSDLMHSYITQQSLTLKSDIAKLQEDVAQKKEKLTFFENLQREYQNKGSAACYSFSFSSNLQAVDSLYEFKDAVSSIVKELQDIHRYQVSQKLNGGRLNIHIEEAKEPVITWLEEWFGGSFAPRQMAKAEKYFSMLQNAILERTMITAKADIEVNGSVKEDKKLLAAHVVSAMVHRMDRTDKSDASLENIPPRNMPITIGLVISNGQPTKNPCTLPFAQFNNFYTSGITGSGKSFTGRVIIEAVADYNDVNILVIDPGNQFAGLLVPEDREEIIAKYPEFGLKKDSARGFAFNYYAPAFSFGPKLPTDLGELATSRSIVCLKNLDDEKRCRYFADIVNAVFKICSNEESESPKLFLVVEEAHRFTKKRVAEHAKAAGEQAEIALDRLIREGRKFGISVNVTSQSIKDFARDFASIRQNTTTKIFMHNSDREIDYAADFIGDGHKITRLKPGTGIFYNPTWGSIEVKIRPPFSKVWDFSEQETMKILGKKADSKKELSQQAGHLLAAIENYYNQTHQSMNISQLSQITGITSKRTLQELVGELEQAGNIQTCKIAGRGQPRLIKPFRPEVD